MLHFLQFLIIYIRTTYIGFIVVFLQYTFIKITYFFSFFTVCDKVFSKMIFTFRALLALPSEVIVWIYVSLKPVNVK